MRYLKVSFVLMILVLFILACSSTKQVQKKPPLKFAGATLSHGIDIKGAESIPIEPTTTFNTQDLEVVARIKFENLSGKHRVRWDWHTPDGNIYYTTGDFPLKVSRGKYLAEAAAWHKLSIQGDKASDYPGQWQVSIFFDDELMETKPFLLKAITDVDRLPQTSQKPYPKD